MPPPVPRPRLELLRGTAVLAQHEIQLDRPLVIGRTEQCAIQLPHSSVSRQHAKVWADASGVYLEDLGSANGSFVDGQRISGVARLTHGQVVQIGQRTVDEPLLLRFEDPATRLLQEMGLVAPPPEPTPKRELTPAPAPLDPARATGLPAGATSTEAGRPAGGPSGPPAPSPPTRPAHAPTQPTTLPSGTAGAARALQDTVVPDDPTAAAGGLPAPLVAVARPWWRSPVVWTGAVLALAVLAGSVVYLLRQFRPAATVWRSVELRPAQVAPGDTLTLVSSDIRADQPVVATIAGETIANPQRQPGTLVLAIPTLAGHGAGSHDLPLVVRERDLEVFQGTIRYVVQPRITEVHPPVTTVGAVVEVRGSGFPSDAAAVEVTIGGQRAVVRNATPEALAVEIPAVTRRELVEVPLSARTGGMEVSAPRPLRVGPRPPRPLDLAVTAHFHSDRGAWELRSAIGPTFLLPGSAADQPAIESRVTALNAALQATIEQARSDPRTTIRAREQGERITLGAGGRDLITFTTAELARAIPAADGSATDAEAVAAWIAGTWNTLLAVVARGEVPATGPPHLPALARLVEINRAGGGDGRPELDDLERLTAADRELLANAFLRMPARFGSLTGTWRVSMPNPADPSGNLAIDLDLRQRGRTLSGTATVRLVATGMEMALPTVAVSGSVQAGAPAMVRMRLTAARPVGTLDLEGETDGNGMAGSARGARGAVAWQAQRTGG